MTTPTPKPSPANRKPAPKPRFWYLDPDLKPTSPKSKGAKKK